MEPRKCPRCHGEGLDGALTCEFCLGQGKVYAQGPTHPWNPLTGEQIRDLLKGLIDPAAIPAPPVSEWIVRPEPSWVFEMPKTISLSI